MVGQASTNSMVTTIKTMAIIDLSLLRVIKSLITPITPIIEMLSCIKTVQYVW